MNEWMRNLKGSSERHYIFRRKQKNCRLSIFSHRVRLSWQRQTDETVKRLKVKKLSRTFIRLDKNFDVNIGNVKPSAQRGVCVPAQRLLWDRGRRKETSLQLISFRTWLPASSPAFIWQEPQRQSCAYSWFIYLLLYSVMLRRRHIYSFFF
jgi:hypothetical protein